jgi:hypothetical protein
MGPRVPKLDDCPFTALTDNDVLDLAKSVRKRFSPTMVISFVRILSRLPLTPCNVFEPTIVRDYLCAAIRVTHIPGFVKLTNNISVGCII